MSVHNSDSAAQREAESYILGALEKSLGATFRKIQIPGMAVEPDGVDLDKKIIVEIFARIGKLKPAQIHKVQADILKLAFIEKTTGDGWRKIICFGCTDAAAFLKGRSWAAEAAKAFGVEVHIVLLSPEHKVSVKNAQKRQMMVNVV